MFYCVDCGTRRIEYAAYCHNCGRDFGAPIAQPFLVVEGAVDDRTQGGIAGDTTEVPWRGGQVVLGIGLVLLSLIPVVGVSIGVGSLVDSYDEALTVWLSVHLMAVAIVLVVWRLGVHRRPAPWRLLGLSAVKYPVVMAGVLAVVALGASLLFTVVYAAVVDLFSSDAFSPPDIGSDIAFPGAAAFFTFQAVALVTPLTEEVFFRGFVFAGLIPRFGVVKATLVSALIFSVFHLSIGLLIPVFVTGLLLALLYRKTGSLWPCIFAHAGQNALAVALEIYGV